MNYKLGLKPSLNFKLHFGNYVKLDTLPPIPDEVDWSVGLKYGGTMFGNDQYGDCFWAAAAKSLMTKSALASDELLFTTEEVLQAYGDATGFVASDPNTDQGTEPVAGFKYLRDIGIAGQKFGPAIAVSPVNIPLIMAACHLGGGLMVGIQFYQEWENLSTWGIMASEPVGGHEIWCPKASRKAGLYIETWGEPSLRLIPWDSLAKSCDQLTVTLDPQFFNAGQAPNGFDLVTLQKDLQAIGE